MKRKLAITVVAIAGILAPTGLSAQSLLPHTPEGFPASAVQSPEIATSQADVDPNPLIQGSGMNVLVNSVSSGSWTDPMSWDCGCSPGLIHEVHIQDGHEITVSQDQLVETLVIESGGSLVFAPLSEDITELSLYGSLLNYGSIDAESGRLNFSGNTLEHVMAGEISCAELLLEDGAALSLEGPVTVLRRMDLISSTLHTNDQLTLNYYPQGFHGLGSTEGSVINGKIRLFKHLVYPFNEFATLSAGVLDATFQEWNDDLMTTGFPGSDFPPSSFISVLSYAEDAADESTAFQGPASADAVINPVLAYYIYANAGSYPLDISGTPLTGTYTTSLSLTPDANPFNEGLHFVGNPFAAKLDWSNAEGWSRENLAVAMYQWDHSSRQTKTYAAGIGVNGGDGSIDMMDGFWVKTLIHEAELSIHEQAKMLSGSAAASPESSVLRLSVEGTGFADEIAFAFAASAGPDYDPQWDAHKFYSGAVPAEIAWDHETADLAIQRSSSDVAESSWPIKLSTIQTGDYTLHITNNLLTEGAMCMALEDVLTGIYYPIGEETEINFSTTETGNAVRFVLHFGAEATVENGITTCHDDFDGDITVGGSGAGPWNYTWYDEDGMIIRQMDEVAGPDTHFNLSEGTYTVEIGPNDYCPSLTVEAHVSTPPAINYFASHEDVDCGEDMTGSIEVEVTGGIPPYTYSWNQGSSGNMLFNLSGGLYTLTLTDANGCELVQDFEIEEAEDVTAGFTYSAAILQLINGQAEIELNSTSTGADEWVWHFGDGQSLSNVAGTTHTYYAPGIYVIALEASNADCSDTYQVVVQVEDGTGIEEWGEQAYTLIPHAEGWILESRWSPAFTEIDVFNLLGQQLMETFRGTLGNDRIVLRPQQLNGPVLIQIRQTSRDWIHTVKRVRQ